ncbi:MAG TPA: alpha/beta hydrolase, partial [Fimbriimonadaceae bacterium]|nr:alpha/beta hydrolase [Fimbriimonadaceae bacterium]
GFGVSESETVLKAVAWCRSNSDSKAPIVLVGVSMGGAASWLAAAKSPDVTAVVTEGTFAKLEPATKRWFNRKFTAASVCLAPVFWFAQRISGVDPATVNPIEAAELWEGKPALVIHGELDQLFLTDEGQALAAASGAPLWVVKGATHAHCSEPDLTDYVDHVTSVLH